MVRGEWRDGLFVNPVSLRPRCDTDYKHYYSGYYASYYSRFSDSHYSSHSDDIPRSGSCHRKARIRRRAKVLDGFGPDGFRPDHDDPLPGSDFEPYQ